MAVAHDASSESHSTGTSVSEASFTWTHTPAGTPRGVLVFTYTKAGGDDALSVTYGGVSLTAVSGGRATDTAGEPADCKAWFLGSGIPTGAQSVVVNRNNNTNPMLAHCVTVTAATDTGTGTPVLVQEDGTVAEQSVNDGSPGTNSVRYAGFYWGTSTALTAGANSTALQASGFSGSGANLARETTAGQGARSVGFSEATSDDRAGVHLAVKEAAGTTHNAAAAITATATVAPAARVTYAAVAALTATATVNPAARVSVAAVGALTATATVNPAAQVIRNAAASVTATATVAATATVTVNAAASITATATVAPAARVTYAAQAALAATATVNPAARVAVAAVGALTATATLTGAASIITLHNAAASVTATATVNPAAIVLRPHRILAIRTGAAILDPNETAVFGQGFSDLATDTAAQSKAGPIPEQRHDRANTTAPLTTQHAGALLRVVTATTPNGELTIMPNVGQELYDVVAINHAGAGLTDARRRVVRVRLSYSAGRANAAPRFEQRLTLSER